MGSLQSANPARTKGLILTRQAVCEALRVDSTCTVVAGSSALFCIQNSLISDFLIQK